MMLAQPWHELPAEVAIVLRPALTETADEMIEAVRTIPAYARPVEGPFGEGLRVGVQAALRHFLAEIEARGPVQRSDVYLVLGRGEMRAGRSLESLLGAYRLGARVAWRRFAGAGAAAGLAPEVLYLLAESLFAYIDSLSAESAEGYALEQSAAAGEAQMRRRRLVRLLVREPPADAETIEVAAAQAGWRLPPRLAVVAIAGEGRERALGRLAPDVVADTVGEVVCAILPDPDGPGRRPELARAVQNADVHAGLGTTVPWPQAALSFARARAALALAVDGSGLLVAREKAGELLLRSEPELARELVADRLEPLASLPAGSRARLTETLRVWLAEQGRLSQVAFRLDIHPQTARYRMARLRELFDGCLDDPDQRFWLELALRVAQRHEPSDYAAAGGTGSGSGAGSGASGTSGPSAPAASSSFHM